MENGLNNRSRISDLIYMLPAFTFVFSILLVRLHLFSMPMTDIYWSEATNESTLSDLFNYWKAMTIIAAACLAIIVLVIAYFRNKIHFKKSFLYIPALVYASVVLLSYAFSDYKYFALRGMSEHFEGTVILLAYILMVFFLANAVDSEWRLKTVVFFVLGVVLLLGVLGVSQAIGHDFFSTAIGQKMITPFYMLDSGINSWDMIDILAASGENAYGFFFTEREVYQTVYNINYVPFYLSLIVPVCVVLFLYYSKGFNLEKLLKSIFFLFLYGLVIYNFFSSNSASGYFGLLLLFFAFVIVFRHYLKKWIKSLIILFIITGIIMGVLSDRWLPEIKQSFVTSLNCFTEKIYADNEMNIQYVYENEPGMTWNAVDFIETNEKSLVFGINGDGIIFTRNDETSSFEITDFSGNQLFLREIETEPTVYEVLDDRFHDYVKLSISKDETDNPILLLTTCRYTWPFPYRDSHFKYKNLMGKTVLLETIEHSHLIKDYTWGTNRGLIWDTTIPLLDNYIFKGAGADVFTFVYPQNDYATRYSTLSWYVGLLTVTDKAHNLYLQYWVNTGLISLLAWLTMVGYYLVGAVKQFRKRGFVDFCDFMNGGIFCGICGFLAVAFFNDGSVNTMPMFYTMLGTGLAINMRDKWPETEVSAAENGPSTGSGPVGRKKKGKKAKAGAETMPEM